MSQPFTITRTVHAPIHRVWQALTSKEEMKQWYFDIADFKPEVGFQFQFTGNDGDKTFLHLCKITAAEEPNKLQHTWQYEDQPEVTYVTWLLTAEGENTHVTLTHKGLESIAHHGPSFAPANYQAGWTEIVGNLLKKHVEQTPDSPTEDTSA